MPSLFKGATLLSSVHPFTATFQDQLRLDHPRAAKARKSISRWVSKFDAPARHEIRQRLLLPQNAESSRYAFYELLTGRALKKLIGNVEREPSDLPVSGVPDYAATIKGRRVVFEVRTLEEDMPEAERRGRAVLRELAGIRAPWVVAVDWDASVALDRARLSVLRFRMTQTLASASPQRPFHFDISVGDARIVGDAYPVKSEMSIIQSQTRAGWSPGVAQIRKAVETKAKAYRPLKDAGIPFVVVVCTDHPLVDAESLCTALFGDPMLRVEWMPGRSPRTQSGFVNFAGCLTPNTHGVVQNSIVSAVWLMRTHMGPAGWMIQLVTAHNPWAANPFAWASRRVATIAHEPVGSGVEFSIPALEPEFEVR